MEWAKFLTVANTRKMCIYRPGQVERLKETRERCALLFVICAGKLDRAKANGLARGGPNSIQAPPNGAETMVARETIQKYYIAL